MNKEKMTDKRAGEIALAIVKYEATRKTFSLNNHDEQPEWIRLEHQLGYGSQILREYILHIILPVVLSKQFDDEIEIKAKHQVDLSAGEIDEISIAILRQKGIDLSPDFARRLKRIEEFTKIPNDELREFYVQFIAPFVIAKIIGWADCEIKEIKVISTT